jgi:hypothetical protein
MCSEDSILGSQILVRIPGEGERDSGAKVKSIPE